MFLDILSKLGINETLWTQLVIFLVAYIVLRALYFKPFLSVMEKREKEGMGKKEKAEQALQEAEKEELRYREELSIVRKEARQKQEEKLSQAKLRASEEVLRARNTNKKKMEEVQTEIKEEVEKNMAELEKQSEKISEEFVQKLIKTEASP